MDAVADGPRYRRAYACASCCLHRLERSPPAGSGHGHTLAVVTSPAHTAPSFIGRLGGRVMAGRWLRRGAALIVLATLLATAGSIEGTGARRR